MTQLKEMHSFSEVPAVDPTALSNGGGLGGWLGGSNRRQLFKRTMGAAVGMSLLSLSYLPPGRRAFASHVGTNGYQIKDFCGNDYGWTNCSPGCGPSNVCGGVSGGPCCHTESNSHYRGWHRNGGKSWKLRPNQCVPGTGWDGWKWRYSSSCGCCKGGIKYRCHDGYNCDSNGNNCVPRVCRWTVECDPPYC